MIYELRQKNDPLLLTKTDKFDFTNPPFDPIEFSKNLVKTMYYYNGMGLSFNQCIIPKIDMCYSIFAMRGEPENFVCFNPKIVATSEEKIILEEGCLTYKNLIVPIKRPRHIRVRFNTPNGDTLTKKFTGLSSRIFQHEMMHLEGKIFFDKLISRYTLEKAIKKTKKLGSNYEGIGLFKFIK